MIRRVLSAVLLAAIILAVLPLGRSVSAAAGPYAGAVTVSSGSLNVRQQPSTTSAVTASLKKGSHITLLSKSGSWWYVQYGKNNYGYCHSNYITPIAGTAGKVSAEVSFLTVRSGPGTSYARLSYLEGGEEIVVLSTANGWSRVLYHGVKTGYVSNRYLAGSKTEIALQVPSFKQTDSRWANVKIGASGKTMAQIGCATTAIAMMESYRTGSTIYPDAMAKKLNYTSSGNVYWPANYIVEMDKTNYLQKIQQLLLSGKPVLFGAKNSYGSQHWVVITGFSGELTAANFQIHDPGSHARVNLQQFLNAYPVFYKYFYF